MKKFIATWGVFLILSSKISLAAAASGPEDSEIQASVKKYMPRISKHAEPHGREAALVNLQRNLTNIWTEKHKRPTKKTRKEIARRLIEVYQGTRDKDFSTPLARRRILQMVTAYGDNEVAKSFVLQKLENGSEEEKAEVLGVLGLGGAVGGDDVYDKVKELVGRGKITRDAQPALLARLDKERALPEILKDVDSSQDRRTFLYSAWALQDYYRKPEYFRWILPRIKELGLDKPGSAPDGGNGLFWIDGDLLCVYLDSLSGDDARLALDLIATHGLLKLSSRSKAIPILQRKLQDGNPETRILAARALRHLAAYEPGKPEHIVGIIKLALKNETNAKVRDDLKELVASIEQGQAAWQAMLKRNARGQKR